jgi:hypothetical protein
MSLYDTAATIINSAAVECGLSTAVDPFASTANEMVQLRQLLTNCGRELASGLYEWQQLTNSYTFSTTATPPANGLFALPSDFGYMINQTGWTPTSGGLGLPLAGPLSEQTWQALVNTNLASSTIYLSFKIAAQKIQILPRPAPASVNVTFSYQSQNWIWLLGNSANTDNKAVNASDIVLFDSIMMVKFLAARFKQAKGIDASASLEQFQAMYQQFTSTNGPAEILSLSGRAGFPYINVWTNLPVSGFGT